MRAAATAACTWGAVLLLSSCLLDVDFEKLQDSDFCGGDPEPVGSLPSCAPLAQTCGPNTDDDCCATIAIQCGEFSRDFDGTAFYDDDLNKASLSDFRLDRYEVTATRFRTFVEAGQGTQASPPADAAGAHPKFALSGWRSEYTAQLAPDRATLEAALAGVDGTMCRPDRATYPAPDNRPVNCVTWYEALAFCIWDGGRLPTEAEWNYVAAGGSQQRVYPWAAAGMPNLGLAVFGCTSDTCPGDTAIDVVGSRADGIARFGHFDIAGNVAEWLFDDVPDLGAYNNPCEDCLEFGPDGPRGIRGGAYNSDPTIVDDLKVSFRASLDPTARTDTMGMRCMRKTK